MSLYLIPIFINVTVGAQFWAVCQLRLYSFLMRDYDKTHSSANFQPCALLSAPVAVLFSASRCWLLSRRALIGNNGGGRRRFSRKEMLPTTLTCWRVRLLLTLTRSNLWLCHCHFPSGRSFVGSFKWHQTSSSSSGAAFLYSHLQAFFFIIFCLSLMGMVSNQRCVLDGGWTLLWDMR